MNHYKPLILTLLLSLILLGGCVKSRTILLQEPITLIPVSSKYDTIYLDLKGVINATAYRDVSSEASDPYWEDIVG